MIGPIKENHPHEWPVTMLWYTKQAGHTIEEIIDRDVTFFEWIVKTFQLVTPKQAEYYKLRTHREIPKEYIQDVTPYEWQKGDPDQLYMELCKSQNLESTLLRFRGHQFELF